MRKLLETIDNLFTVKRTNFTLLRIFMVFCIILLIVAMIPIYFKFEDYNYKKYKNQYDLAKHTIHQYKEQEGNYPIGEAIDWTKEKELRRFFEENRFTMNRRLYYVNKDLVPQIQEQKYVYIVDIDHGVLYTRQFVVYHFRRWHFAR